MARKGRIDESREPGGYSALPWSVIDSKAYQTLSHPAKALLIELARQYVRNNNGRLLASSAYLAKRGWNSRDVITRAKVELINAQLIYETVMGHRPNKASWYAVTWYTLDRLPGYDAGAVEGFRRGMYQTTPMPTPKASPEELFEKWRDAGAEVPKTPKAKKVIRPSPGLETPTIVPSGGLGSDPTRPSPGTIKKSLPTLRRPSGGNHLEIPFCTSESAQLGSLLSATASATTREDSNAEQVNGLYESELDPPRIDPAIAGGVSKPTATVHKKMTASDITKPINEMNFEELAIVSKEDSERGAIAYGKMVDRAFQNKYQCQTDRPNSDGAMIIRNGHLYTKSGLYRGKAQPGSDVNAP